MSRHWLTLHRCRGISTRRKRELLEENGYHPERALKAAIARGASIDRDGDNRVLNQLSGMGGWIVNFEEDAYPATGGHAKA